MFLASDRPVKIIEKMSISNRLKQVAGLVTEGYVIADIGTDHGYVPVYLLRNGRIPSAIAVDLSRGSLDKARENAERAGLSDLIECRLSDGLSDVSPGEAQCIIICGMGGILMRRILDNGIQTVLSAKELILSPHRNPELIYEFIEQNGFVITDDLEIEDKKKKYKVIKSINPTL